MMNKAGVFMVIGLVTTVSVLTPVFALGSHSRTCVDAPVVDAARQTCQCTLQPCHAQWQGKQGS